MKFLKLSYNPNRLNKAWLKLQLKPKVISFKQLMRKSGFKKKKKLLTQVI